MMSITARKLGLMNCSVCHQLVAIGEMRSCPRCHTQLHLRKPDSLTRTWALLLTAVIFYIPANLYPVMTVIRLGQGEPNTILSGVAALIHADMWPLALIVFVASVVIPLLKIIILGYLAWSVGRGSHWRPRERTMLYRFTETFGHWSMVDVFLVAILAALVDMGNVARIIPGMGVSFFAIVVILTILAAKSFDPRLIWDIIDHD